MRPTLRPATLADLPALVEIDTACFASPWTTEGWRAELTELEPPRVWIADRVGLACAPIVVDACELRRIAVVPSSRGTGLGRDLLTAVIAHARANGCERVELEVANDNLGALGLYRDAGFVEVGRRPRYYSIGRDRVDAVLLTLDCRRGPVANSRSSAKTP